MTEHDLDPLVARAVDELRTLPHVPAGTVEQVAASAIAARRGADTVVETRAPWRRWASYAAVALAACALGYAAHDALRAPVPTSPANASPSPGASAPGIEMASNADPAARPVAQQFVFQSPHAHRVAIVGDFNAWNPNATPLVRAPNSGLWSVTVPLMPGRHMYAFMVDDTVYALDPRAPVAHDPDLSAQESVVVVEHP